MKITGTKTFMSTLKPVFRMAKQKKILFRSNWAHPEENGTESALPALALYLSNCNRGLNFHKRQLQDQPPSIYKDRYHQRPVCSYAFHQQIS